MPLDRDGAALAVFRRRALDTLALAAPAFVLLRPQGRDMFAGAGQGAMAWLLRFGFDFGRRAPGTDFSTWRRSSWGRRSRRGRWRSARRQAPFLPHRLGIDRRIEISAGFFQESFAELVAQHAACGLLRASPSAELAELERPEGKPDQPIDGQAEMFEHALDLAILAFAQAHGQPDIGALHAIERRLDAGIVRRRRSSRLSRKSSSSA